MSADKRKVSTDALETLGTIIEDGGRDAIHLAVEPVIAGERLYPGQHIGIVAGKATTGAPKLLGIVDPFINGFVPEGSKFWLVVYPRQITSLRHVWTHPDFEEVEKIELNRKQPSEKWLRDFCSNHDCPSYDVLISALQGLSISDEYGCTVEIENDGNYLTILGQDASGRIPDEFWYHVEVVTGKRYPRATYFSCSC